MELPPGSNPPLRDEDYREPIVRPCRRCGLEKPVDRPCEACMREMQESGRLNEQR